MKGRSFAASIAALPWPAALRDRLAVLHPDHRAIVRGMAFVATFVLIGRLAGAAKEIAVAYRYGISADVDAYLFVLNIVTWPMAAAFSILSVVLVPLVARLRQRDAAAIREFRAELLGAAIVVGCGLGVVSLVGVGALVSSSWSGLPPATARIAGSMSVTLAWLAPFGLLVSLLSAWTLASGRHVNTAVEGIPALVIAAAVLIFPEGGAAPLVWATLVGYACHAAALAGTLGVHGEIERPRWRWRSSEWRGFWNGFSIMIIGQLAFSMTSVVDQLFAADLGVGAVSGLGYANRIVALIVGLGATAVSRATLPIFSAAAAQNGQHVRRMAMHWAGSMGMVGIAALAIGWVSAPWMVHFLFEHGAFTSQASEHVTGILRFGLLQLPFFFAGLVLVSYLSSERRYVALFWSGVIGFFVKIAANVVLARLFGVAGIAMAWAVVYAATTLYLLIVIRRETTRGQVLASAIVEATRPRVPVDARVREMAVPDGPRKVLFFIFSLGCGGAERVTVNLANHWAARGRSVEIITMSPIALDFYALHPAVRRRELKAQGESRNVALGLVQNVRRVQALRQILRSSQPDVAISMMWTANILLALAMRGVTGVKAIGSERNHPPRVEMGAMWRRLQRTSYGRLEAIVALASESADWLLTHTSARRSPVIPNVASWPIPIVDPILPPAGIVRGGRKLLLAVGRLEHQKGTDRLIDAFALLASAHPDWDLVILGEGAERKSLTAQIHRAGLADRVLMPGQAGNVGEWYARADLYVLPSRFEGFPNTLAEAMAHGLAAVAFDCDTGPRDIIRHDRDGLLVPPGDVPALAAALERLMGDAALRERFAAAAIATRDRYSEAAVLRQWESLFRELVR